VGEFGQERGIDGIGFGPRLHGFGEAFGSLGVDHHDLKSGIIQGQRQIEVIKAGCFGADAAHLGLRKIRIRAICPWGVSLRCHGVFPPAPRS